MLEIVLAFGITTYLLIYKYKNDLVTPKPVNVKACKIIKMKLLKNLVVNVGVYYVSYDFNKTSEP